MELTIILCLMVLIILCLPSLAGIEDRVLQVIFTVIAAPLLFFMVIDWMLPTSTLTDALKSTDNSTSIESTVKEDASAPLSALPLRVGEVGPAVDVSDMSGQISAIAPVKHVVAMSSSDTSVVCLRPTEVEKLASAFRAKEGAGPSSQVLWGDKGVWSTKMNYEPSPKFNLFKPFKYEQSKFYFWGISYVNGKKQMRVAGTTLTCTLPDAEELDVARTPTKSANLKEAEEAIYKLGRVGYVQKNGAVHISESVNSDYNIEVMYRVGKYVQSMVGNLEKFDVKPNTLHFANVLAVNDQTPFMMDFKNSGGSMGSETAHRATYVPVVRATLLKLKDPAPLAYTDFQTLAIDPAKLQKKATEGSTLASAVKTDTEALALKLKALESEVALLRSERAQLVGVPKVPVPTEPLVKVPATVATPVQSAIKVDESTLAKNISGN